MVTINLFSLLQQTCFVSAIVLIAMVIDLCSGLYKAKIRGEIRSSWGLKRSVSKFILYEGAVMLAGCIDVLFGVARFFSLLGLNTLDSVAIFSALIGVILCIVELWSLREKADEKTRKDVDRATQMLTSILDKKELTKAISKAVAEAISKARKEE